jgi:hypothetical protein
MWQTMAKAVGASAFYSSVDIRDMKLISAIPSRPVSALLLAALLAGCATTPQTPQSQVEQASAKTKACYEQVGGRPEFKPIGTHFGVAGRHTIAQMADEAFPTAEEAKLWAAMRDGLAPCFKIYADAWMNIRPDYAVSWMDGIRRLVPTFLHR